MWREPTSFQSDRAPISIAFVWHAGGLVLSSVFTQIRGNVHLVLCGQQRITSLPSATFQK